MVLQRSEAGLFFDLDHDRIFSDWEKIKDEFLIFDGVRRLRLDFGSEERFALFVFEFLVQDDIRNLLFRQMEGERRGEGRVLLE